MLRARAIKRRKTSGINKGIRDKAHARFLMTNDALLYWSDDLMQRCRKSKENMVLMGIRHDDTDAMVLSIVEESKYEGVSEPYEKFGVVYALSTKLVQAPDCNYGIVRFKPPKLNMMQFYSLEPISLALQDNNEEGNNDNDVERTNDHFVSLSLTSNVSTSSKLRKSIDLLNMYYRHLEVFEGKYPKYKLRSTQYSSFLKNLWLLLTSMRFYLVLRVMLFYGAAMMTRVAGFISGALNYKSFSLVKLSATAQQIDLRCQQLCYIPVQYLRISNKSLESKGPLIPEERISFEWGKNVREQQHDDTLMPNKLLCETYPDYIRLYNTLWLIVNDISFGATVGAILYENRYPLSRFMHAWLKTLLYDIPYKVTSRLEANPLGIKLNEELSRFLSSLFISVIEISYSGWIRNCIDETNLYNAIAVLASISSLVGLTFLLALIVDFLSLITLHFTLFYLTSVRLYGGQIFIMRSLFYLFYGKKRNVLRNRIDSNFFELDQLVMGTIIFVVLTFLLPTVFSFFLVYTIFRYLNVLVTVSFDLLMALINHFPLFALLLRVKDPKRLPGGISLSIENDVYVLSNNPISFTLMFRPYSNILKSIQDQLLSVSTLRNISRGSVLNAQRDEFYRVLYYTLPQQPIDPHTLWAALKRHM